MGLEARCQGRCGGNAGEGRLQHEGAKILFRGAFRLDVEVKDLKKVAAEGADLLLAWGKNQAAFTLGAAVAAKWAQKILHPPSLLDKLGIKDGSSVAHRGAFEPEFLAELAMRVKASPMRAGREYDVVLFSFATPADLETIPTLVPPLTQAGALWMVYPKGGQTIKETQVRAAGLGAGLVDNKTCSFSSTLTALRWVRPLAKRK